MTDLYGNLKEDVERYIWQYTFDVHLVYGIQFMKVINYSNYWKIMIILPFDINFCFPDAVILNLIKTIINLLYHIEFIMCFNKRI